MVNIIRKVRSNLEIEFLIVFCVFIFIIMFSGAFYLTNKQKAAINLMISKKGESIAHFVADMVTKPILENDAVVVDRIVSAALHDREITYILIENAEGTIVNSLTRAMNIGNKEYEIWGIDLSDEESSISSLLKRCDICSFDVLVEEDTSIGRINIGLSREIVKKESNKAFATMMIVTIIVIAITIWLSHLMFKRLVIRPLGQIVSVSEKIADGYLDSTIEIRKNNEIGLVADTINAMSSNMKSMISSIKELFIVLESAAKEANEISRNISADTNDQFNLINGISTVIENNTLALDELSRQTNELKASSEDTSSSILELVSSSSQIAGNMDILTEEVDSTTSALQQISSGLNTLVEVVGMVSEAVEETSSSTGEMMASIKQIEETSEESRKLILSIKKQTEETGLVSIHETIEGMQKIKDSVELTGEVISILDSKSMEIDKILQVIDEVTDRTTLLSLNATILAAQAGQHGKSFAVVAAEIKNLAEDTSSSTQEISDIINMIQKEIKTAVTSMAQGVEKVSEGFRLAEDAGRIFNDISGSTQQSSDYSENIYIATQEQSQGIDMVVKSIQSIEEQIGGLMTFVREQKEAMDQMLFSVEKMRSVAHQVKNSTDEQKKASDGISESAENVSNMASAIAIALSVINNKSSELIESVAEIKQKAHGSVSITSDMSQTINDLHKKALMLKDTIDKFHV